MIFGAALALILRESIAIDKITRSCIEAGYTCWPNPSAFTRYAIYASMALVEACTVFMLSLRVEEKMRRQNYAPEWR